MKQEPMPKFDELDDEATAMLVERLKKSIAETLPAGAHFFLYVTGETGDSTYVTAANFGRPGVQVALLDLLLEWSVAAARAQVLIAEAKAKKSGPKIVVAEPGMVP